MAVTVDLDEEAHSRGVAVQVVDGVATVLLTRPEKHNALTPEMRAGLLQAFHRASEDDAVRVVVLRGEGKSFCAGQDMRGPRPAEPTARAGIWKRELDNLGDAIAACAVPVVAALQGNVLGRGLDIALSADLRVATDDARFGFPEIRYGMVVGGGGGRRLVRAVGEPRAMEMLLCGTTIDAQTALSWGLVNRVVPSEQLDHEINALTDSLVALPDLALYATKTVVRHSVDVPLQAASWTDTTLNILLAHERRQK